MKICEILSNNQCPFIFIRYDVSVMDSVRSSGGPLLVEIERTPGTSLGITLVHAHTEPGPIIIETIRNASIAER